MDAETRSHRRRNTPLQARAGKICRLSVSMDACAHADC
jgi:hypothetical protein